MKLILTATQSQCTVSLKAVSAAPFGWSQENSGSAESAVGEDEEGGVKESARVGSAIAPRLSPRTAGAIQAARASYCITT